MKLHNFEYIELHSKGLFQLRNQVNRGKRIPIWSGLGRLGFRNACDFHLQDIGEHPE